MKNIGVFHDEILLYYNIDMCGYLFIIYHLSISIMYQCIYLYIYLYIYHVSIMYLSTYHLPIIYRLIDHLSIYQSIIYYLSIHLSSTYLHLSNRSITFLCIYLYISIHPSIYLSFNYLPTYEERKRGSYRRQPCPLSPLKDSDSMGLKVSEKEEESLSSLVMLRQTETENRFQRWERQFGSFFCKP